MNDLQKLIISFVLTAMAVIICYLWLDRPVAFYIHDHVRQFVIFDRLTLLPEWIAPFAAVALAILGLRALANRRLSEPETVILLCGLSLIVADAIKNQLKFAFGRTWPESWMRGGNPSLIQDGVYGFNPFHGGAAFASFPSGHTTAICALMSVLWICYPRLRPLYLLCVLAVAVGLVGADYHFLSDIIAGTLVGTSTGWIAVALWRCRFQ